MEATQSLLTLSQAAQHLGGISERTVRRLIADNELQSVKIRGCAPRVLPESIRAYIDRLAASAHNPEGAGQASQYGAQQCQSANQQHGTRTESTSGQTRRTGGPAGQAEAARRLAARLGLE